jgi:hypothetical protein
MNINIKRMSELNKIRNQIRNLRSCIKNDCSTIERFRKLGNKEDYYTEQIEIRICKNIEREKEIKEFENRMSNVKAGVYDQEFVKFEKISADQIKMNIEDAKQKKDSDIQKKKEEINISKAFEQSIRRTDRNFEYKKREMDKSWQYFLKSIDTFPEYMNKKLKNMPNNNPYIWKTIQFYGERQPIPREPVILFETQKEGILVIHEITNTEYKIWHKKGTLKKILYSSTPLRQKKVGLCSLGNFIKIK